jgi:hypothetical protein
MLAQAQSDEANENGKGATPSGNLKGIAVRCGFNVPAGLAHQRSMELQAINCLNPGSDCVTGDSFYIYNVGSQEVM